MRDISVREDGDGGEITFRLVGPQGQEFDIVVRSRVPIVYGVHPDYPSGHPDYYKRATKITPKISHAFEFLNSENDPNNVLLGCHTTLFLEFPI